ncbi:MAG: aminopeptidase [Actinobacteria bacterium]|nr:aminopeptidase [Actinomycetota bacterium]
MPDTRVEEYARLLVEHCLGVEAGQQVLVFGAPSARQLVEEVVRLIARKGAYALVRLSFDGGAGIVDLGWSREAPEEVLREPAPIELHAVLHADALLVIVAPENTREASDLTHERQALVQAAYRPALERVLSGELPWTGCQFPCPALAQEAGMSLRAFEDFLYGACLLDWDAEGRRMRRYADAFDAAREVRILGEETDLTLSLEGRQGKVDAGGANVPGGEFFFSPLEDSAEGTIAFTEFPAVYAGRELSGIRLRFEGGRVVDASAERHEDFLVQTLDTDEGARRIGELGIGCNPGITRYLKNTLFDEKIDGTVHIALGSGFPFLGGTNESVVHWDLVKDLRAGGRILLDGEVVQEDGAWTIDRS